MKLEKMQKEELEILSYTDLTEMIIKENKKPMKTADIFKLICSLLELTEEDYANKIGDFYTSMTTDKRFILLENAEWDLRDKHKIEINLAEEDEDEYLEEEETDDEESEEVDEDNSVDITDDEVDLDDDNDMEDLTIVTDSELDDDN